MLNFTQKCWQKLRIFEAKFQGKKIRGAIVIPLWKFPLPSSRYYCRQGKRNLEGVMISSNPVVTQNLMKSGLLVQDLLAVTQNTHTVSRSNVQQTRYVEECSTTEALNGQRTRSTLLRTDAWLVCTY
jgi:hypothetical protein